MNLTSCVTHSFLNFAEIPIFFLLNAQVTFGNVYASRKRVKGVKVQKQGDNKFECTINENLFKIPPDYTDITEQ